MIGDLIGNILQIVIDRKDIIPKCLILLIIKKGKLWVRINLLEFFLSSPKHLMGKVQENLSEDSVISMII
jgi:hypothetical protein